MEKILKNKFKKRYALIIGLLFFLIIIPIITVFFEATIYDGRFDLRNTARTIIDIDNIETIFNSLFLGILVVGISTIIATPLAFFLSRGRYKNMRWLDIIFMIPFMTPPYILSMGWILFMQKKGLFQQLFPFTGEASEGFFSLFGLALAMSFHVFPFMTTILKNAILNLGNNLDESGAVCGASFLYRIKKITLPLLKGNYAIAMLLVFVKTLSEYGTPATLGRRIGFYVFTTDIHKYATTAPIDFGKAASLSSVLITICILMWMIQNYVTTKNTYALVGEKGSRGSVNSSKIADNLGGIYIVILIIITISIPYFSVIVTSFINLRGYGLQIGNFTFKHYIELFTENAKAIKALTTSTLMAFVSASVVAIVGTIIVVAVQKAKRIKKVVVGMSLFPRKFDSWKVKTTNPKQLECL